MKILHTVEFYSPSVGGAQQVVRQLSERMVTLGHDVTVATTAIPERKTRVINGVKIKEFSISGNEVRGYTGDTDKYKKFLIENKFDVVMNYAAQQWTADLFFEVMDKVSAAKVFVPCGFSGLYSGQYREYFNKMPNILRQYDCSVYLSDNYKDVVFARKHSVSNTVLIPNAADEIEFASVSESERTELRKELGLQPNEYLLVTIGSHTGVKGHAESMKVLKKLRVGAPVTLLVVGNMKKGCYRQCQKTSQRYNTLMGKFSQKRILVVDWERPKTVAALKAADVFLFLSNIECSPLVLFEAAAAGTPFVSTQVGNSKEIAEWLGSGLIAQTRHNTQGLAQADLADATNKVAALLSDPNKRKQLGEMGRKRALKKYTWDAITRQYLDLYLRLQKNHATS